MHKIKFAAAAAFFSLSALSNSAFAFYYHTDAECRTLGDIAEQMVKDRQYGKSYRTALSEIDLALKTMKTETRQNGTAEMKYIAKTIYVDMQQLSPEGARKLIAVSCVMDSDNLKKNK